MSHHIFSKSNLVYIPLTITIAHTLNFIVNSPLSTWQEFPPKLPNSVYMSLFFTPYLLFISLTFEPIQTRKRFYTLLSLLLIFVSIPLSYRGAGATSTTHNFSVSIAAIHGLKMLLFLKLNGTYLNKKKLDQKKEFKSYLWSVFNWRPNSYTIPPKSEMSNEKENPLIIKSPTTSQINKKLIKCFLIFVLKWLLFELAFSTLLISTKGVIEVPEKFYQVCLVEFFTKGITPITMSLLLHNFHFLINIYLWLSLIYDNFTLNIAILFRLFFNSTSENDNQKPILIKFGLLAPLEYVSLKEWMVSFLFNSKHMYDEPWLSSSPREFWSVRWQTLFNEFFKELGFLPVKNFLVPIVPRKIANMMGVLAAFGISSLLHEYLMIANFNVWTGEQIFFFMSHGVIFILWEIIFGYEKKNKVTTINRILKWILLVIINLLILPGLLGSSIRNYKFSDITTLSKNFVQHYMN